MEFQDFKERWAGCRSRGSPPIRLIPWRFCGIGSRGGAGSRKCRGLRRLRGEGLFQKRVTGLAGQEACATGALLVEGGADAAVVGIGMDRSQGFFESTAHGWIGCVAFGGQQEHRSFIGI